MAKIRCPYCHKMVEEASFDAHEAKHRKAKADGQQTDYVTLPETQRKKGKLDGVPTVYVHDKCGGATGMPEDIIRSYLKNPFLYMADATFCTGCGKHVPFAECEWTETGENLQDTMDDLREAKPHLKPKGCLGVVIRFAAGLGGLLGAALS